MDQYNAELIYNPSLKKFSLTKVDEVTVFISSGYVELLNDEEVEAILLHEIGHNTMVLRSLCTRILNINLGKFTIQFMILTFLTI